MGPGLLYLLAAVENDLEESESAGVQGVRAFDHPAAGVVDLDVGALRGDLPATSQFGKQLPGHAGVVAGVEIDPDGLGQVEPEPGQPLQGRAQQRRVVSVGDVEHDADRQAVAFAEHGALLSGFAAVGGIAAGVVPAAGGLHSASVDTEVFQVEADQSVEGLQDGLRQVGEHPGGGPFVASGAQDRGRDLLAGVLGVGPAQHEPGDEPVEHDLVWDERPMAAQWMGIVSCR